MHQFVDAQECGWRITLNKKNVRALWDLLRINLHDPADIARCCNSERYMLLPQILAVLCREEAERRWPHAAGKPEALVDEFDGLLESDAVFERAHAEFCGELADFCRSRGRAAVAKYLDATPRLLAKESAANEAALPDLAEMEADLDRRIPGNSLTSSPAKSESSPTD